MKTQIKIINNNMININIILYYHR